MGDMKKLKDPKRILLISAVLLGLLLIVLSLALRNREKPYVLMPEDDDFRVSFIDVGQGDCTLIWDNGSAMLIDAGPADSVGSIEAVLAQNGIDTIDSLILSHPDADHIGGAPDIILDHAVTKIYMPDYGKDTKAYDNLMHAIADSQTPVFHAKAGERIPFGTATYEVIGPVLKDGTAYDDANSYSIVLKVTHGNDTFLFTGDATGEETDDILRAGFNVNAQVLRAAHHGSANYGCNDAKFWLAVNPEVIVISCGYKNDHGHPHKETMEMTKMMRYKMYRTDLQGTVSCNSSGNGVSWSTAPCDNYLNGNAFE